MASGILCHFGLSSTRQWHPGASPVEGYQERHGAHDTEAENENGFVWPSELVALRGSYCCLQPPNGRVQRRWGQQCTGGGWESTGTRWNMKKNKVFIMRVVKHWNRLARQIIDLCPLRYSKTTGSGGQTRSYLEF